MPEEGEVQAWTILVVRSIPSSAKEPTSLTENLALVHYFRRHLYGAQLCRRLQANYSRSTGGSKAKAYSAYSRLANF